MRKLVVTLIVLAAAGAGVLAWRLAHPASQAAELVLHGDVELRQVDLAFHGSERIKALLVEEGDHVHKGQLVARMDDARLVGAVAQARGQVEAMRQAYERLKNGSRPEEISQARANVDMAAADAVYDQQNYTRIRDSVKVGASTQQELDNAKAAIDMAEARLVVNRKALDLAVLGPRKEDVAQAEGQWHAAEGQLAVAEQELADANLLSPCDGVVRSRVLEPGEMASPQRAVLNIAETSPKWVRAYVSESDLGKVRPGTPATVSVDAFPGRRFEGWIGFVSPVAEFTPKTVETQELRTSLVYEVRVLVRDGGDELRLGSPADVHIAIRPTPATGPAPSWAAEEERRGDGESEGRGDTKTATSGEESGRSSGALSRSAAANPGAPGQATAAGPTPSPSFAKASEGRPYPLPPRERDKSASSEAASQADGS